MYTENIAIDSMCTRTKVYRNNMYVPLTDECFTCMLTVVHAPLQKHALHEAVVMYNCM